MGFAKQSYINFRSHASSLIAVFIKFDKEKFGPIISNEIIKQFDVCDNPLNTPCLINAACEADYVDGKIVDLLYTYAKQNDYTHPRDRFETESKEGNADEEDDNEEYCICV